MEAAHILGARNTLLRRGQFGIASRCLLTITINERRRIRQAFFALYLATLPGWYEHEPISHSRYVSILRVSDNACTDLWCLNARVRCA